MQVHHHINCEKQSVVGLISKHLERENILASQQHAQRFLRQSQTFITNRVITAAPPTELQGQMGALH